jgi:hypothetical protein
VGKLNREMLFVGLLLLPLGAVHGKISINLWAAVQTMA